MRDHSDLIERLRGPCIDWTGEPIVDGSTPRTEVHCGLLREAADALSSQSLSLSEAREEIERLKGLVAGIRECPQEPCGVDATAREAILDALKQAASGGAVGMADYEIAAIADDLLATLGASVPEREPYATIVKRLLHPPFGTETSERLLMGTAADAIRTLLDQVADLSTPSVLENCKAALADANNATPKDGVSETAAQMKLVSGSREDKP